MVKQLNYADRRSINEKFNWLLLAVLLTIVAIVPNTAAALLISL